jgi:type I restriction enzyme M protein
MIEQIPAINPELIIDLAVGSGELLWYAKLEWPNCQISGFDVDDKLVGQCKSRFGIRGTVECLDSIRTDIKGIRNIVINSSDSGVADLALSNPPYGVITANDLDSDLLDTLSNHNLVWTSEKGDKQVHAEVAFLVRNLELIKDKGYIAILLPDGAISGVKTEPFRHFLRSYMKLLHIISLPSNSFDSCEARITLLIAQKSSLEENELNNTQLCTLNGNIDPIQTVTVKQNDLLFRMDPKYHFTKKSLEKVKDKFGCLNNYIDSCSRGYGFYSKDRNLLTVDSDFDYIHSVNIGDFMLRTPAHRVSVNKIVGEQHRRALVKQGDVLFVRVGKGCVGRCAIVNSLHSYAFASDCVYILSSQRIDTYYLCLYLNTRFAKNYFDACCRGVCSQYIIKEDLLNMPLYLPKPEVIERLSGEFKTILDQINLAQVPASHLALASVLTDLLDALIIAV